MNIGMDFIVPYLFIFVVDRDNQKYTHFNVSHIWTLIFDKFDSLGI